MSVKEAPTCTKPCCSGSDAAKPSMSLRRHDPGHTHAAPHSHKHTDSDCGHDHSDVHAASERNYQDWLEFYNQLVKLIHKLEPDTRVQGTYVSADGHITTNATAQFRDQINKLTVYENDGKAHEMRGLEASGRPPIPNHPKRIVAHIRHFEVELNDTKIEARGFKHDLQATGFPRETQEQKDALVTESFAYVSERAEAAFSMVYMAKAKGWDKINFVDTKDPIDRAMLIQACKHLGVDYGGETVEKSVVPGVKVDPVNIDFPLYQGFRHLIEKDAETLGLDASQDGFDILSEKVFMLFIKHPEKPAGERIEHHGCGHKPKYNLNDYPFK